MPSQSEKLVDSEQTGDTEEFDDVLDDHSEYDHEEVVEDNQNEQGLF
jgi:hypothetical protein